jgi:hypothetical protein
MPSKNGEDEDNDDDDTAKVDAFGRQFLCSLSLLEAQSFRQQLTFQSKIEFCANAGTTTEREILAIVAILKDFLPFCSSACIRIRSPESYMPKL